MPLVPFYFERASKGTLCGEYVITGDISGTVEGTCRLVIEVVTISSCFK
ncbi:hypothetical protein BROSI_A1653 [Candidatus Brocadia sinica JPN1]|uniref:Uncharacterized protein n=1 Tax=Candidatus Brocadia sinica JPN1 TaxID=1197129 RepID=A0ABQ0JWP1_9BACT|nr:hypothetical protein BROSI_A1653 [Candidatus Brocadia sinica JPN1]